MTNFTKLFILVMVFTGHAFAQNNNPHTKDINDQVWTIFINTWNDMDAKGFQSVHSDEVLRAGGERLRVGPEYFESFVNSFARGKASNRKRTIDLRFEHRVAKSDVAYEVGYYKITDTTNPDETREYVGRFHVVLRKMNGVWKIVQDWDTNKVGHVEINTEFFDNAKPMEASF